MNYEWLGYGLVIVFGNHTLFLQGDEAAELYDQCEACETEEQLQMLLDPYSELVKE